MKNNFKKILSFLLVFIITFSSNIPVFAENRANSHYFNLLNVQSSESENVNEEVIKKISNQIGRYYVFSYFFSTKFSKNK